MNAQLGSRERPTRPFNVRKRLEEVPSDDPEKIHVTARRVLHHLIGGPPDAWVNGKPPDFRPAPGGSGIDGRNTADLGAALNAGMSPNWNQSAIRSSRQPARKPDIHQSLDGIDTVDVLSQSHRPDEHRVRPPTQEPRKVLDSLPGRAAVALNILPVDGLRCTTRLVKANRALAHEVLIDSTLFDKRAQYADEKRQIAAGIHLEPVVGKRRAGKGALRNRRNPVPLETGLAIRVHYRDLRAV